MPVRSARLAAGTSTNLSEKVAYTCPAGKTAILKDVRIHSPVDGLSQASVFMVSGPSAVTLIVGSIPALGQKSEQGFIVLEPGDQLRVFSNGGTFNYWLSGAELDGLAP